MLVADKGDLAKDLYVRIEQARLSPQDAERCDEKAPSLRLTQRDVASARSGTDVIKVLVLVNARIEPSSETEFEVLKSSETLRGPELLAEAARRGTVIAALEISDHLPPLTPLLRPSPDD